MQTGKRGTRYRKLYLQVGDIPKLMGKPNVIYAVANRQNPITWIIPLALVRRRNRPCARLR